MWGGGEGCCVAYRYGIFPEGNAFGRELAGEHEFDFFPSGIDLNGYKSSDQ